MLVVLYIFICAYYSASFGMSAALTRHYPELDGWGNVSRALGWPVTLYEINADLI